MTPGPTTTTATSALRREMLTEETQETPEKHIQKRVETDVAEDRGDPGTAEVN
jgi:hypothetical protein